MAAVISRGDVSNMDDPDPAAGLWIGAFAIEVSDTGENPLDGGRVLTDHVGRFRDVETIAGAETPNTSTSTQSIKTHSTPRYRSKYYDTQYSGWVKKMIWCILF